MATLTGTSGNDTLTGGAENDSISGLEGDDTLEGLAGNDTIDGGTDTNGGDWVSYQGATSGVSVNLTTGVATDGLGGTDTLLNIERILGTAFNDVLTGNLRANRFRPGDGNDTVNGVDTSYLFDRVEYSDASSSVKVDLNAGTATGTSIGTDTLISIEAAEGSGFNDEITLPDRGEAFGMSGNDLLVAGKQYSWLEGGLGNDTLRGGVSSYDTAAFNMNATNLDGLTINSEQLAGSAESSWTINKGSTALVRVEAKTSTGVWTVTDLRVTTDTANPNFGVDQLTGVERLALSYRNSSNSYVSTYLGLGGTQAAPTLNFTSQTGTASADTMAGSNSADTLTGGAGNDSINGLGSDDVLRGGAGDDILNGGEQRSLAWKPNWVFATSDWDTADYSDVKVGGIRLDLSTMKVTGANGADVGTDTLRGIEAVHGTPQSDTVLGSFVALSGNNEGAGDQHGVDFVGYGGSDNVTLTKAQSMPWVDTPIMLYWWSKTGVSAVFTGSVGTISYTASDTQAAGADTTDGFNIFGDSPHADRFDFSGMTSNWRVGSRFNYVTLHNGGNDTVVGNGDTAVSFPGGLLSTTGLGVNVRFAAPGTAFTVDMTHLSRSSAWSYGTVTLSNIDNIRGTNLNDTLVGGIYDDYEGFRGRRGDDFIDGGSGDDQSDYWDGSAGITVNLAAGTASGDSSVGNDTLRSIERIRGTAFADVYDARGFSGTSVNAGSHAEWNTFEGRGGDDTIHGNGKTRIEYISSGVAVEVNLATGKAWALNLADRTGDLNQYVGTDTFTGVFRVRGSALGDLLLGGGVGWMFGDTAVEVFEPDAGNDTVNGFGGFDQVRYGSSTAAITVDLRLANLQVQDGMGGVDTLIGIEAVRGSDFNDSMVGSDTNKTGFGNQEEFTGGKGNDTLNGGGGYDEASYTDDPTNGVVVNLATGVAQDGWGGTDTLSNIEGVEGSWKDDSITGSSADNRLDGRAGNDTLDGGAGSDTAEYNQANGAVQVNLALGTATGADGNDTLSNIENVYGSIYGDTLTGNAEANTLQGLAGDDTLSGGAGNDTLDGGLGTDRAVFSGKYANYTVSTSGNSTIVRDKLGTYDADTLLNMEELAFSDKTVPIPVGLRGIAYDWKNHMLLKDVSVGAAGGAAPVDAPILFKPAGWDASGHATVEVWSRSAKAFENVGFEIEVPKATGITFSAGAFPANAAGASGWTMIANADGNKLSVGGFANEASYAVAAGDFKLGTVRFETGSAQSVDLLFLGGDVGGGTASAYGMSGARTSTDASGAYSLSTLQSGNYSLTATRATTDIGSAVTSADALAALKLAVGINPNPDPDGSTGPKSAPVVSPYQFMAADVIGTDGQVTSADALAILKMAVKLPAAPTKEWMFVEESRDFWNETTSTFTLNRKAAAWDHSISVKAPGEANLVGVLKGDVNGSWTAPTDSLDLDTLVPTHFTALSSVFGMPVAQFGIV